MRWKFSLLSVVLFALLFVNPPSARAGGWVVVTVDTLPDGVIAGQELTIEFMVRQHGQRPIAGQAPKVELTHQETGDQLVVTAEDEGPVGHYVARLLLPTFGTWEWKIRVWGEHPMPPLQVRAASGQDASVTALPAEQSAESSGAPSFSVVWLSLVAVMLAAALAAVLWRNRSISRRTLHAFARMPISKRVLLSVSAVLLSLTAAPAAYAKGPVDKIVIAGPGLAASIEITDAADLSGFNPWSRTFIAWNRGLVAEPPSIEETYAVSFLKKGGRELSLIYMLHYAPGPSGGPGYIYIPGPDEPWYWLNIGTISTGSSDRWNPNGKWQYATVQWDALMLRALNGQTVPVSASSKASDARAQGTVIDDAHPFADDAIRRGGWLGAVVLGTSALAGVALSRLKGHAGCV